MAETWYLRDGTGDACGPGTRRDLSQTIGSSVATQDLASEHTWNRVESARTILSGTWTVTAWVTTAGGGGQAARVTATVRRMNSSCAEQEVIGTAQSANLASGATTEVTFNFTPGAITFASGDRLLVQFQRTQGTRTTTLRFNHNTANTAESRLVHPDELVIDALTATGLVTGAPALAEPTLEEIVPPDPGGPYLLQENGFLLLQEDEGEIIVTDQWFVDNLVTGAPVLGEPTLQTGDADDLTADSLVTGDPVLGQPDLGQIYVFTATGIVTGAVVLGTPSVGQVHSLSAANLLTGSPVTGEPTINQIVGLVANGLIATPVLGTPTLAQTHALTALGLTTGVWVIGLPTVQEFDPDVGIEQVTVFTAVSPQIVYYTAQYPLIAPFELKTGLANQSFTALLAIREAYETKQTLIVPITATLKRP